MPPAYGMRAAEAYIMHVDMDAFYASVELSRRPELRGVPMMVGGATRGVVLSATYEARVFEVEGGMPMTRARRLCPQAVVVPPDYEAYEDASEGVFAILDSITDTVERASIDEAFLDVTAAVRRLGPPRRIGEHIRALVSDEQQINCSVGIGPNKFVAKLASAAAKPDGLHQVDAGEVIAFLHPLPVERVTGIGEATAEKLHRLGLTRIADLANTPVGTLQRAFGPRQGVLLAELAWGRDARSVIRHQPEHSIGSENTFGRDTDDPDVVTRELLRMSVKTASRLRYAGYLGRSVVITVRFADYSQITRTASLSGPTDVTGEIYAQAMALWQRLGLQRARIRKVGVRVAGLVERAEAYRQPTLTEPECGWREAEQAADAAVRKFGPAAVQRASLTGRG